MPTDLPPEQVEAIANSVVKQLQPLIKDELLNKVPHAVADVLHSQPHIEGLLHVGALALAVLMAYLGLDRLKRIEDPIRAQMEKCESDTRDSLSKLGCMDADGKYIGPDPLLNDPNMRVLCAMARTSNFCESWRSSYRWIRRRADRWMVYFLGGITTPFFLALVGATLWPGPMHFMLSQAVIDAAFTLFIFQMVTVAGLVAWVQGLDRRLKDRRVQALAALNDLVKGASEIERNVLAKAAAKPLPASPLTTNVFPKRRNCPADDPSSPPYPPQDCKAVKGAMGRSFQFCPETGERCPESP